MIKKLHDLKEDYSVLSRCPNDTKVWRKAVSLTSYDWRFFYHACILILAMWRFPVYVFELLICLRLYHVISGECFMLIEESLYIDISPLTANCCLKISFHKTCFVLLRFRRRKSINLDGDIPFYDSHFFYLFNSIITESLYLQPFVNGIWISARQTLSIFYLEYFSDGLI